MMERIAPASPASAARTLWLPRQHGAWAMLAVPFLVGVAASAPSAWQLVLAVAAVAGYLAAATAQAWLRSRRRPSLVPSLIAYGIIFAASAGVLLVAFPALALSTLVMLPAGALVVGGARAGTPRDLANSLGQAAIVLVLVPAAALVSGAWQTSAVLDASLIVGGYLVGTVLVVRSVIRERGNRDFVVFSVGFHVALAAVAAALLPWPYAVYAIGLAVRAFALPLVERRRAGTRRPLRPVHVGIVEMVASTTLVVLAFAVPV
jgi:hypothetical protein